MKPPKAHDDRPRADLKLALEQLAIYRRKAEAEEMRSDKLLAQNASLTEANARLTQRAGELFAQVLLRDEGLVQTVLHFAPHGDPPSTLPARAEK